MEFERITTPKHYLYEKAMALYKTSFPIYEQREDFSQLQILQNKDYHFDIIKEKGEFIGEILYWDIGGVFYIEHFCIHSTMRNKGFGQKILNVYQSIPLILEIDKPINEISIRRKGFYERCGFVENSFIHIHPAYHKGNAGHELIVMSSPKKLNNQEYERFNRYLKETVMKNAYK